MTTRTRPMASGRDGIADAETPVPRLAVSPKEASEMLGISPRLLFDYTKRGEIPSAKIGARVVYRVTDLEAWLAARVAKGPRR